MMLTTHLLAGLLLALPIAVAYPSLAVPALIGAAVGSVLPDLDLYYGHRQTLHYPTLGFVAAVPMVLAAVVYPHPWVVAGAFITLTAAVHARMDIYGGGLELRPWAENSQQAVYDHVNDEWIAPRRFVRYDGAPEDVATAMVLAAPPLLLLDGPVWYLVVAAVAVSVVYGLVRKPIVDLGVVLLRHVPRPLLSVLPMRYLEGELADRV